MTAETRQTRRDQLIAEYQDYVHHVVGRLVQLMNLPSDLFDEYVSAGYLGLVEAAERYETHAGHDFKAYAFLRIRGAVIDSIRRCSDLSGKAYRYSRVLAAAQDLREELSAQEAVSGQSEVSSRDRLAEILDFAAKGAMSYRLTLQDAEQEASDNQEKPSDLESLFQENENNQKIRHLVETLPEKERLIIEEYYFHDKSFAEIVQSHPEFSKSWVSRLHVRGLELLQGAIKDQAIRDALEVESGVRAIVRRPVVQRVSGADRARPQRKRRKSAAHKVTRRPNRGRKGKTT